MHKRWLRVLIALASVVGAYWVYALAVVPWIEPQARLRNSAPPPPPLLQSRIPVERFVPSGAWELDNPKVLETAQGMLLFKDYEPREDGSIELNPFTLILRTGKPPWGAEAAAAGAEPEKPLVIRAPEGAVLRFDRPLDLTQARIGRLVGGLLKGEITIRSPASGPGADDLLEITARNVQIDERRIWTPHDVAFRLGRSFGAGRDLTIELNPPKESGRRAEPGGLKSLELVHIDRVHVYLEPTRDSPGQPPNSPARRRQPGDSAAPQGTDQPTLLEITCRGPFRFDFRDLIATFEDQVDVIRLNAKGPSDQLRCQRLAIHLARDRAGKEEEGEHQGPVGSSAPADGGDAKWSAAGVERIVAYGRPVVLRAPSAGAAARGERLTFDFPTRRFSLEDSASATLEQEGGRIEAPQIRYEPDPNDPTRLGRLWAAGPGRITAARGEDPASSLEASWGKELRLERQDGVPLLTLDGGATIALANAGRLSSQAVYVWLRETPRQSPADPEGASPPDVPESAVLPDRMLALGEVRIDSPQLTGAANRVEIWFRQPPPGPSAESPEPGRPRWPPEPARQGESDEPLTGDKLDFRGDLVRVQLYLAKPTRVEYVTIDGDVIVRQISTSDPQKAPLRLTGDLLQLENPSAGQVRVRIDGRPARVAAAGAAMTGDAIQLAQGDNRVWIDGAGEMTLPLPAHVALRGVHNSRPATVAWSGRMDFDGRRARFERDVRARGRPLRQDGGADDVSAESDLLEVELTGLIDFAHPQRPDGLAVRRFVFPNGVRVQNRGYDKLGVQQSHDQLSARSLTIDQQTGRLSAAGPGWVSSVRHGQDPRMKAGVMPAAPPSDNSTQSLNYLRVAFQSGVMGDLSAREVEFHGHVKTIYGPVGSWDEELNAESRAGLGERGVLLTCDVLNLAEMSFADHGRRWLELEASGNTYVQGGQFAGRGAGIKYVQAKDLLVLEGASRSDAVLMYQPRPGATPSQLKARKIYYWPSTNSYRFEDINTLRLDDLRAARAGSAP